MKKHDGSFKMVNILKKILIFTSFAFLCIIPFSSKADIHNPKDTVEEKIWQLEEAYFANLYKANYDGVLAIVHDQFLGWPGSIDKPIDKEGSSVFMRKLIPSPAPCSFTIEREGIKLLENIALTQYIISVSCKGKDGKAKETSSRITHTWIKEGKSWKLFGGMSYDK
jgi:hypothetical protein